MKRIICAMALTMCLFNTGCKKEPANVAVETVTLNTTSLSLTEGESAVLSATIFPSDATDQTIFWTTNKASVATVENGLVKAISAGSAKVTATSQDGGKTASCMVSVKSSEVSVNGVSLDITNCDITIGNTLTLKATVSPSDATNKSVRWTSSDESVAKVSEEGVVSALGAGKSIITVTTVDQSKTASCVVTVLDPTIVDLGLSVKWRGCNLGASKPEEYGDYYQWAGTEDVSDTSIYLDYENCPYHTGSDETTGWTKYISTDCPSFWSGPGSPDNNKNIDLVDDAAHVVLGGNWRIPTNSEWTELQSNCSKEWTTMNGVNGMKFTSTINGNSIFFPAAGFRDCDYVGGVGSYGYYWSSLLIVSSPCHARYLLMNSNSAYRKNFSRYAGMSIRPVTD